MNWIRRRKRSVGRIVTAPLEQLNDESRPDEEWFDQQIKLANEPAWLVTAKVTFKTVPARLRSNDADQDPETIVSPDRAGSVKKQTVDPLVSGTVLPKVPCVVFRPLTVEQSEGVMRGSVSRRKNVEFPKPSV